MEITYKKLHPACRKILLCSINYKPKRNSGRPDAFIILWHLGVMRRFCYSP